MESAGIWKFELGWDGSWYFCIGVWTILWTWNFYIMAWLEMLGPDVNKIMRVHAAFIFVVAIEISIGHEWVNFGEGKIKGKPLQNGQVTSSQGPHYGYRPMNLWVPAGFWANESAGACGYISKTWLFAGALRALN
ncbi:hypothetical protein BT96DRAFT_980074 [Gymnopus androsaceus JB14]|uniref:Uncharacterized protein n=1 Tax=Gymnopus androsaceus JB14 TaxID=1447944 RepID=A0A6A4H0S5_9AGAR|nr:hypothetical protein BT96DRAFT_980074 [Gymnopus androsaceus JB14]